MSGENWVPVGTAYLSDEAYGERMVELGDALEEAGFRLNHDPLRNQADIEMRADADPDARTDGGERCVGDET